MSIQSAGDFHSSAYQDCSWKNIFCAVGSSISTNQNPMGLVNRKNLMMAPDNVGEYDRIQICFHSNQVDWVGSDIVYYAFPQSLAVGIAFFKIDKKCCLKTGENNADIYIHFLQEIGLRVNQACRTIFKYTYEHLSHRYYDDVSLSKIPIIQSDFSKLYVLLEKLTLIANDVASVEEFLQGISISIDVLSALSKLSGARCVLQNRSLELMYHLKIFQLFLAE